MENDVDIYADLPSFSLHPEKNDQDCNCGELKKEFSSLVSKLEDIQKIKTNLEKNLSSLLKTARAEIARKDKMIDDLRKQLDDVTFRRNNRSEASCFSTHRLPYQHIVTRKYENIPSTQEKVESHQIQFHHDDKSWKSQIDVNRLPTLFGDRLQKKIMEDEKEEKEQKALLKLSVKVKTENTSTNKFVENDKENESKFSINNNIECNIERCSNSESPERNPYRKNLMKRMNEEHDTRKHKRLKIENNEDKATNEEPDYNYLTQCDLTDNSAQYEMKNDPVKFEDRSNAVQKEEASFHTKHRATSECREQDQKCTKQNQDCSNGWRNDMKNNSVRDYNRFNVRNDLTNSLRNSRSASTSSTSNYVSEGYKKNRHRYSPSRRSYSRSRSDYESLSSRRLHERSSRTYREKKYDDYKYDMMSRYKNGRLKWSYENEENDGKTRYRRGERVLWDRSRYSSSDAEDRESSSSYKNKKYENHKIKKEKETANVLNNKKLHEINKATAETNFRKSFSRTSVNSTTNYIAGKNVEQQVKNESETKSKNLMESTSAHVAINDLDILEEGEILDSPEKKNNSTRISENNQMEENNIKSVPIEDKNEEISVNISIDDRSKPFQNDANSNKKEVEMADINTTKIEVASCLLQQDIKDSKKEVQLSSNKNDMAVDDKVYNCRKDEDTCKSYINNDLMDSTTQNIGAIKPVRDSDVDSNDKKNDTGKTSKDSITEDAKIKETTANIESVTKIKELNDSNIESATEKEEVNNSNIERVAEITEANNFNSDNSIHKIDDKLKISTGNVEAVLNCNIEDRDKSQAPTENETFHQISDKSNVEICLNDHNYVQNPFINTSDLNATQKPSSRLECNEAVKLPKITVLKETKVEETINVQSVNGVKRTFIVKNKKDQQSKGILISHRRKAVILSDSNASMTVLMNTNITKTSSITNNCNDNDVILKPRACKISRVTTKVTCK